jgi:polysaccharide biosynthesis protein PslH
VKILYLCHRIPYPPDKGDKIRAFHQVRSLARRHEVDLFTLADDARDLAHEPVLREYCREIRIVRLNPRRARFRSLPYFLTKQPLTVPFFYSPELRAEVSKAAVSRSYDRVLVYSSAMAQYVDFQRDIPVVTDLVDVDSDKWLQYAKFSRWPWAAVYRREGRALREYEKEICNKSTCVVVTTDREASLVREIARDTRVWVIPNGVDTGYFQPAPQSSGSPVPTIGFTGDMSYFPNAQAVCYLAREVLPLVRERVPETRFLIVGRNPSPDVRRLAAIEGVEVTGFVPDVRDYFARMQVAVAPFSIAAGIQNKILEAMASAIPVVATARAAQGLAPRVAGAVEIAHGAETMAAAIVDLLRQPALAREKGMEGRRRVEAEYRWEESLARLEQLLENPAWRKPMAAAFSGRP